MILNKITLASLICTLTLFSASCGEGGPFVEVGGDRYTESDLKEEMPNHYADIRKDYEEQVKKALERLGEKKLMEIAAEDSGATDANAYISSIRNKIPAPTEAEIQSTYRDLKKKGQIKTQKLEQIRGQLISYLRSQRAGSLIQKEKVNLKKKYGYRIGPEERKEVDIVGEPTLFPNGKLLVVEFSGYECPFCKKVQPAVKKLREKYGNKLKWVVKDYPLRIGNIYSHVAASCVFQQDKNKFWQLYDYLFSPESDRSSLEKNNLNAIVAKHDIDMNLFAKCTEAPATREEIMSDHREGQLLGVRGIPYFFINGKALSGAQPYEVFEQMIELELNK